MTTLPPPASFPTPTLDQWRALVERDGTSLAKLATRTPGGVELAPLYTAADADGDYSSETRSRVGEPGWELRQRYSQRSVEAVRVAVAADVAGGVEGVQLVASLAGASDDGVAIGDVAELEHVLEAVDLARHTLTLELAGESPLVGVELLVELARRRGVASTTLRGGVVSDPYAALARGGRLPASFEALWDGAAAAVGRSADAAPGVRPLAVSTLVYREAGADPALELGLLLAALVETLRELDSRGVTPASALAATQLQTGVGRDLLLEIAKLRALRQCVARVAQLVGAAGIAPPVFAAGSTSTRTRRDPWVNMLRGTSETFAAIVGGADAIATTPFDAALGDPDSLGLRVARNTQLVLRHESHLDRVADPARGSYAIERLTRDLAERAWIVLQELETEGGLRVALLDGAVEQRIGAVAATRDAWIRSRKLPVVGVSEYPDPAATPPTRPASAPRAPATTHTAAAAVASGATLAELAAVGDLAALSAVTHTGDAPTIPPFARTREAAAFEDLADRADALALRTGRPTGVRLEVVGDGARVAARVAWTTRALEAGGLAVEVRASDDVHAPAPEAAVVAGHDDDLMGATLAAVASLRAAGTRWIIVAGRPRDPEPLRAAGADDFIGLGVDLVAVLDKTLSALEGAR
ncbi:MAG: hypothetical protein H6700_08825 [Myxococcales bacterium]|nr:hypothetical protein [Myxococcales bacterium]MCB9521106.1 hypothetical protein [Myxococcales bacterium]MCB9531854.1 hypothetical protein [Myxococcales bacterium]